jgi:hypothetical protein
MVESPLADEVVATWGEGTDLEPDNDFVASLPTLMSYSDPGSLISGSAGAEGSPLGPRAAQRGDARARHFIAKKLLAELSAHELRLDRDRPSSRTDF